MPKATNQASTKRDRSDSTERGLHRKHNAIKIITAAAIISAAAVLSIIYKAEILDLFAMTDIQSVSAQADRCPLTVFFPDSGTAGCALVHGEDFNILIDCGREKAQTNICTLLGDLGAEKIDLAVLTHPDSDHIGNFSQVADRFTICEFLTSEEADRSDSELYRTLMKSLEDHGVNVRYARPGEELTYGKARVEVIAPLTDYKNTNDSSVVLRLEYGGFTALFPGDITKKAEKDILESGADISAQLLYVPHHGSAGSSGEEFLKAVSPQYAVISVEEENYLPAGAAIQRLRDCGCEIYRTDESGGVAVFFDGSRTIIKPVR